ncbi:MAG: hypothetical protein ACI9T9_001033 [Oleiphilaceae bacterium]|jgi:uncharacterized protein YjaG (DUF416 family)
MNKKSVNKQSMNKQKFQKNLQSLSAWRERAFILSLAERALPNAVLYITSLEADDSEYMPLSEIIEGVWQHLIVEPNEENIIALLDQVMAYVPETEDSEHYGALPTADCLSLLEQAMLGGLNEEKRRALDASQTSLTTVLQFIDFSEGDDLSENQLIKLYDTHSLVEREFSFQEELNDILRSASHPGIELITELRALAQDGGVSNIGISLN